MDNTDLRAHRCCFTGHRPEKLGAPESAVQAALKREITVAAASGYTTFLTGMARGVDLWAAEIVLDLKRKDPGIRLVCAIPCTDFEARWPEAWQAAYRRVLAAADWVKVFSDSFRADAFQIRNRWMVDHAALVIAVYNGTPGGTRNTVAYAQQQGATVRRIAV